MPRRKQNKISICFIVKANQKIGYGHLMRCKTLAEEFKQIAKCNIMFFPKIFLNKIFNFDICITDLPDIKEKELEQFKKYSKLLASIDDGHKTNFFSDILINPNINPKIKHRFSKKTKYFSGKDYIILRKEFEKFAKKTKTILKKPKQIFVCFGGSDPNNLTEKLIRILKEANIDKRININIILGPLFGSIKKIEKLINSDSRYILHKNISGLAKTLWQSDLAIISGGTLMYETCFLRIPAIIICQNEGQNKEAEFFGKKKAVIDLGVHDRLNNKEIKNTIMFLLNNLSLRKKTSERAKKLINPGGGRRIAEIILKEYFKKYV